MGEQRSRFSLSGQLNLLMPLAMLWLVGLSILAAVAIQHRVPHERLFLDAASVSQLPWYTGLMSSLGVLAWTVAVVSCAGGAWVAGQTRRTSAARFLGAGAAVTTVLLADDLLQLHAVLLPEIAGIPKTVAIALVCFPTIAWAGLFTDEIARTRWVIFGASGLCLAGSVLVDQIVAAEGTGLVIEDGLKFIGILTWALYCALTTVDITRSTISAAMAPTVVVDSDGVQSRNNSLTEVFDRV